MGSSWGVESSIMRVKLGHVGHFGLAVHNPEASAAWWQAHFDLNEIFRFEDGIGLSNDNVTIVLTKGEPHPATRRLLTKAS